MAHSGLDRAARRAERPRRWLFFEGDDGYIGIERGYHGDSIISWDIQNHLDMISVSRHLYLWPSHPCPQIDVSSTKQEFFRGKVGETIMQPILGYMEQEKTG